MKGDFSSWKHDPTKHYTAVYDQQGRVQTDADRIEAAEIADHLRRQALRDLVGTGAPRHNAGFGLGIDSQGRLVIGAGHFIVDGILCVNETDILFTDQPDLPGQVLPEFTGIDRRFLVYLDVWHRHITALEDPDLREVALAGADTTTRKRVCCGVRLFEVDAGTHCLSPLPLWEAHIAPSNGRLAARAEPLDDDNDPCLAPPRAGYTGLQDRLYRVEIHQGGDRGQATCTFDRDNGSFTARIDEFIGGQPTDRLRIARVGKWDPAELEADADVLLELTDDALELAGEPGILRRLVSLDPATGVLTLDQAVDGLSADWHPKLRRRIGDLMPLPVDDDEYLTLEHGVQVRFGGDRFRTGDHWLLPTRTATADVEWPTEPGDDGEPVPLARPSLGPEHHHARLGLLELTADGLAVVADCRALFHGLARPALRLEGIRRASDNAVMSLNGLIRPNNLSVGLILEFNAPLSESVLALTQGERVALNGALQIEVDLPDPLTPEDRAFWGMPGTAFGVYRSFTVPGTVSMLNNERTRLLWQPIQQAQVWLGRLFTRLVTAGIGDDIDRVRARLRIRGHALWADGPNGERIFLDGRSPVNPTTGVGIDFSSGDGHPGDDLDMWFWLIPENVPAPLDLDVSPGRNRVAGNLSRAGTPLEGATILLRSDSPPNVGNLRTTQTDSQGQFLFTAVSRGQYTVIAQDAGETVEQEARVLAITFLGNARDRDEGGGGGGMVGPGDLGL